MASQLDGLRFDPPPECSRPGCCDLSCVMDRPAGVPLAERQVDGLGTE